MSSITKSASAEAAFSPTEPSPPAVSVRLAQSRTHGQLRIGGPHRVGVVRVQRMRDVGHRGLQPLVVVLRFQREGHERFAGLRQLRVAHAEHRVGDVEFGGLAHRPDRPQRVVHVVHDLLRLGILGRVRLGGGVDRHPVVGERDLALEEGLVVEGVVPRRAAGHEVRRHLLRVLQRLDGLGRIDDHLVFRVDQVAAERPQAPVHPGIAVARGAAEREAARRRSSP